MGFSNTNVMSFSKKPVRPIQCPRQLLEDYEANLQQQQQQEQQQQQYNEPM